MMMDELTSRELRRQGDVAIQEINDRIRTIIDRAPSDAGVELLVHKTERGYKGLLKVSSSHRRFVGGHNGADFDEVVDRVFEEVKEQIDEWKRARRLLEED